MLKKLGDLWCTTFHTNITWPMRGEYWCRDCGRRYQVFWTAEKRRRELPSEAGLLASRFSFQKAQSKRKWEPGASGEERSSALGHIFRRA
jgi:hypothetical protein